MSGGLDVKGATGSQRPLVIFEGPNAAGKTTLANWLASRSGSEYRSSIPESMVPFCRTIDGSSPEDSFHFYAAANAITYARLAEDRPHVSIVLDRSHLSTVSYHAILLGRRLSDYSARMKAIDCFAVTPIIVYVTAEARVRESRVRGDQEKSRFFDVSFDPTLDVVYQEEFTRHGWPIVSIDTTSISIEEAGAQLQRSLEEAARADVW